MTVCTVKRFYSLFGSSLLNFVDVFMLPSQLLYTDTLNVHVSVSSFVSRLSVHSPAFIY